MLEIPHGILELNNQFYEILWYSIHQIQAFLMFFYNYILGILSQY